MVLLVIILKYKKEMIFINITQCIKNKQYLCIVKVDYNKTLKKFIEAKNENIKINDTVYCVISIGIIKGIVIKKIKINNIKNYRKCFISLEKAKLNFRRGLL